jgi:hypothetical protein
MSISIALLPLALAMRVVMGKEKFEAFVRANQIRIKTEISTEGQLIDILASAGFDANKYGAVVKTHLVGGSRFMIWELEAGKWSAVFPVDLGLPFVENFFAIIKGACGKDVLSESVPARKRAVTKGPLEVSSKRVEVETLFMDKDLLVRALDSVSLDAKESENGVLSCMVGRSMVRFEKKGDEPYRAIIEKAPGGDSMYDMLSEIDEEYKREVQTSAYHKVLKRATEMGLQVEQEEITSENTIVVTLRVV